MVDLHNHPSSLSGPETRIQPEIQGLRAIAVLAVLVFHIWPLALPGGYVGVDVFFVISGFLITRLLLREAETKGQISLARFYRRRIRRLLPAATLVIVVASLFFSLLPQVQWPLLAWDALASALYVQNWWLTVQAVDYLAEDNAPGLLQHYWSLSVEEQYYIVWPLIIWLVSARSAAAHAMPAKTLFVVTMILASISLIYSIYVAGHNPALGYFATTTRAWELAVGGILATLGPFLAKWPDQRRATVGWLGLLMIAFSCVGFGPQTAFPGYAALLPTCGAALIIVAGRTTQTWSSYRVVAWRPLGFLGDISYSLYLWHWPLLIVYRAVVPGSVPWFHGIGLASTAILLAWLTKIWVEDPIRKGLPMWRIGVLSPAVILGASVSVVLLLSALIATLSAPEPLVREEVDPALMFLPYDPSKPTIPPAASARQDNPDLYRLKCHVNQTSSDPLYCEFGPSAASRVVALVGDSHAAQWLPALQEIYGDDPDWRVLTFTKSACAFNAREVTIGKERRSYRSCSEWNGRVLEKLRELRPEIVVVSSSSTYRVQGLDDPVENLAALAQGLLHRWGQLREMGASVVVIRDTPRMDKNVPECMTSRATTIADCSTSAAKAIRPDPIVEAMRAEPLVSYIDLTREICDERVCSPVRGQVLVYRDSHHLTATYVRLLARKIAPLLP